MAKAWAILDVKMIEYFTDGSASPNPGPGGYAVISDGKPVVLGSEDDESLAKHTTNIRMEGKAIIEALKLSNGKACRIHSDSEFWINVITKWSENWEKNNWTKKNGPIKNLDIVKEARRLYKDSKAELIWVRGHDGLIGNELADEWANKARQGTRLE